MPVVLRKKRRGCNGVGRGLSRLLHTELHWLDVTERVKWLQGRFSTDVTQQNQAPRYLTDRCELVYLQRHVSSASALCHEQSTRRAVLPAQHLWPSGVLCSGTRCRTTYETLHELGVNAFRQSGDVLIYTVLVHSAH